MVGVWKPWANRRTEEGEGAPVQTVEFGRSVGKINVFCYSGCVSETYELLDHQVNLLMV
jgi:hypothetical protein